MMVRLLLLLLLPFQLFGAVKLGIDQLVTEHRHLLQGKRIGLMTNHTGVDSQLVSTVDLLRKNSTLSALFAPEHGLHGFLPAEHEAGDGKDASGIPIYSLYGKSRRPDGAMLRGVDLIVCDIQDIGSRSYTYISTLFFLMEEAAKQKIPVIVCDRPNPINGLVVDGPMLESKWRSIVGYINVPYCHGMTVGELAHFFNEEYQIGCNLTVIPMQGWKRWMTWNDTGLAWIPTSPHIPEATTPLYYPTTGILGELQLVSIGIGYTLPFKLVGAPWIEGKKFADSLNQQNFPGVRFLPIHYRPFYGKFAQQDCEGVQILVTDPRSFQPVSTQFLILGILKSLYPKKMREALPSIANRKEMFHKVNGTEEVWRQLEQGQYIVWKLKGIHQKERNAFLTIRKNYLIPNYN